MRPGMILAVFLLVAGISAFILAPYPLMVSDPPRPSDAAVLFVGPDSGERRHLALDLLKSGLVKTLIIPADDRVLTLEKNGRLHTARLQGPSAAPNRRTRKEEPKSTPLLKTHVEVQMTLALMRKLGFTSANLVSSPYHMRRIQMIANRVFDDDRFRLHCVAAGRPDARPWLWWLSGEGWWWIPREYAKIFWFLAYEHFQPGWSKAVEND